MTRERLIEIYEAELRGECEYIGEDFDLCRGDIVFTAELLPSDAIALEHLAANLLHGSAFTQ